MYLEHYGLSEKPFAITPDPDFLVLLPKHREALAMLEYGVFEQSGITLITGEVGCGKTTLLRHLIRRVPPGEITLGLISNVHASMGSLLSWVLDSLGIHTGDDGASDAALFRQLQKFLVDEYASNRRVVIIVDEAQNMDAETLEELRMLTNINADKDQLLQVVLAGQPELLETLTREVMAQLAQRVTAEYHLPALTQGETAYFIRERLRIAGAEAELFNVDAISLIYYCSGGVPRLINTLCDHALVLGYARNAQEIDFELAMEAVKGKRIGGVLRFGKRPEDAGSVRQKLEERFGLDLEQSLESL